MRVLSFLSLLLGALVSVLASDPTQVTHGDIPAQLGELYGEGNSTETRHTNNWAVLVCASRYWFNYRVGPHLFILISSARRSRADVIAHGKHTGNVPNDQKTRYTGFKHHHDVSRRCGL
jgi:hypothetical protein